MCGLFFASPKRVQAAGEATNNLPADGTYIVVSDAGAAAGSFSSPESSNYLYIPANTAANVWLKNISNGPLFGFNTGWLDNSGTCNLFAPSKFILYPVNGSSINIDAGISLPNQATVVDGGVTLKTFCVMVTTHTSTSGSNIVNFQLESTPGTKLGVYAGTNTSTGTGFFANNGSKWSETISFAPSCEGSLSANNNHVLLYDLDNGYSQNPNIDVYFIQYDRQTGAYKGSDMLSGDVDYWNTGFGVNVFRTKGNNSAPWNNNYTWHIYPTSGSYDRNSRYELHVTGIGAQNKIRIRLPFDQINSTIESCSNPSPIGYADSCQLVGTVTRIYGWGYENDNAAGPQVSVAVGGSSQTVTANEPGYRVSDVEIYVANKGYGTDAYDHNYGWHADYTGLRRGTTYGISGTLLNSGTGNNSALGVSVAAFTSSGTLPAECLPEVDAYSCSANVTFDPSNNLYVQQTYSVSFTVLNTGTTTWNNSYSIYNDAADNTATPYNEATHNNLSQSIAGNIAPNSPYKFTFTNLSSAIPIQINYNFKMRHAGASVGVPFDTAANGCTGSVYIRYCPPGSTNSACGNTVSERGGYVCSIPSLTSIEAGVDTTIPISASYSGIRTSSAGTVSSMNVTATGVTRTAAGIPTGASRDTTVSRDTSPFNFPTSGDQSALGAVGFRVPTGIFGEPDYNGAANCGGAVRTGYKPYVKAYGGDVWAGAVFDIANSCQTGATNKGAIYAYANSPSPGKTEYTGASNQLGTTALMKIDGFYSGSTINPLSILGIAPKGQTFANNAASTYGGDFGGNGRCMIDYFNNTRDAKLSIANPSVATLSSLPAGSGRKQVILPTGNQNLGAITIQRGAQVAVYVDGDAYITSNIVYDTSARSSLDDIPSFSLVAKGNIYISSGVTRIDGLYIAQPRTNASNETTGKIFTCTNGSALYDAATLYTNCNSQLAVNGSLVAKQIKLLRLKNSLKDAAVREVPSFANGAGTNAAEVINYSPESFVGPSGLARPNSLGIEQRYDSIKSLPPVY